MTKDQRTIKAQAVQIAGLTTEAQALKSDLENVRKYKEKADNARLTWFLAQTNGIKVEQPKEDN